MIKIFSRLELSAGTANEECPSNMEIKQITPIDTYYVNFVVVYGEKLGERLRDIHTDLHTMI